MASERQDNLAKRLYNLSLVVFAGGVLTPEVIDLLSSFGLQAPISYDDSLQRIKTARNAIR